MYRLTLVFRCLLLFSDLLWFNLFIILVAFYIFFEVLRDTFNVIVLIFYETEHE